MLCHSSRQLSNVHVLHKYVKRDKIPQQPGILASTHFSGLDLTLTAPTSMATVPVSIGSLGSFHTHPAPRNGVPSFVQDEFHSTT